MSSIYLSDNHFILQSTPNIREVCNPFLAKFNLTYFDYCRIYRDGRMSVLANDPNWVKHFFAVNYPAGGEVQKKGIFLWPTHLPEQAIADARNTFNHDHGMTTIFEQPDYIEFFDFAAARGNNSILYYYLNHFHVFEQFFTFFRNTAQHLIKESQKHLIRLGMNSNHNNIGHNNLTQVKDSLWGSPDKESKLKTLSNRQLECLLLLVKGMTIKLIAQSLELSPRTVEDHLNLVKQKLNCSSRSSLISKALTLAAIKEKLLYCEL